MPRHRGPAPDDPALFAARHHAALRSATEELAWLAARGYAAPSALKLVGDRHALRTRQRQAVERGAVAAPIAAARRSRRTSLAALRGGVLAIDGFNVLIVCESARSGAPLFRGLDGALRDLGGVHGSWHRVEETEGVLAALALAIEAAEPARVRWVLDRPVGNSGRLAGLVRDAFARLGPRLDVELDDHADRSVLRDPDAVVASADGWILDHARGWIDLPSAYVAQHVPDAWCVALDGNDDT